METSCPDAAPLPLNDVSESTSEGGSNNRDDDSTVMTGPGNCTYCWKHPRSYVTALAKTNSLYFQQHDLSYHSLLESKWDHDQKMDGTALRYTTSCV
jgi:hypothetical protein